MTPKLLLADDSVTIQRVIELTFADENVQVVAVGDGRAALDRVKSDPPDIVLADVGMPERNGYEVAEFIKGDPELKHIPVLLLTGAFEPVDDARARAIGCDGVLVKPFEPQMVINRVRELLNREHKAAPAPAAEFAPAPVPVPVAPVLEPVGGPQAVAPIDTGASQEPARPAAPVAAESAERKGDSLENYFDRLDAALANFGPPAPAPEAPAVAGPAPAPQREIRPVAVAADGEGGADGLLPPLHAAFNALLAAERGEPAEIPIPFREPLSDAAIDEIATRVIARMGDAKMRALVLDTAERLVREEIERIKKHQ